jgi:hypothetical protein
MKKGQEIKKDQQPVENNRDQQGEHNSEQPQRSGAFNEQSTIDRKSTHNIEEEAGLEQDRKDALTERD